MARASTGELEVSTGLLSTGIPLVAAVPAVRVKVTFLFDGEAASARQAAQQALVLAALSGGAGGGAHRTGLTPRGLIVTSVRVALRNEEEVIHSGPAVIGQSVTCLDHNLDK